MPCCGISALKVRHTGKAVGSVAPDRRPDPCARRRPACAPAPTPEGQALTSGWCRAGTGPAGRTMSDRSPGWAARPGSRRRGIDPRCGPDRRGCRRWPARPASFSIGCGPARACAAGRQPSQGSSRDRSGSPAAIGRLACAPRAAVAQRRLTPGRVPGLPLAGRPGGDPEGGRDLGNGRAVSQAPDHQESTLGGGLGMLVPIRRLRGAVVGLAAAASHRSPGWTTSIATTARRYRKWNWS